MTARSAAHDTASTGPAGRSGATLRRHSARKCGTSIDRVVFRAAAMSPFRLCHAFER